MISKIRLLFLVFTSFCRVKLLRLKHKKFSAGKKLRIDWATNIDIGQNQLTIGNNVYLRSSKWRYHAGMSFPTSILIDRLFGVCSIGDNCRINGCYIHVKTKIIIERNTVIAAGTQIIDSNGHETYSKNRTVGSDVPESIFIGENVWIGLNSIILKGTTIGKNSIIAAGSIVKGTFPDNSLIQGNPGVLVKQFDVNI